MSSKSSSTPEHLSREAILSAIFDNKVVLKTNFEAISILFHAIMKQLGFRFVGCGETINESVSQQFISQDWNSSSDCHSFLYKHKQSSMTYCIKVLKVSSFLMNLLILAFKMGTKVLVNGVTFEQNSIFSFEAEISDYVNKNPNFDDHSSIYTQNLDKLIDKFVDGIAEKLFPTKSQSTSSTSSTQSNTSTTQQPHVYIPPTYPSPLLIQPPLNPSPLLIQPPFSIGGNDLDPFSFPSPDVGTGNLIGPQHPSFFGQQGVSPLGRGRGRGNKPKGVPPDARFDPFGPGPHFGEPDNDDFEPPGNMYL